MLWKHDQAARAYSTDLGGGHARIWEAPDGTWSARLTVHRKQHMRHDFPSMDDARQWCEEQLHQLVARDRGTAFSRPNSRTPKSRSGC